MDNVEKSGEVRRGTWKRFKTWPYKKPIFVVLVPLVMMWLPIVYPGKGSLTGFIMVIMASYWVTEVLPLAVTAMIPLVLLPLFEILTVDEVCLNYMKDIIVLLIGGLMVALSIEKSNLHRRIALRILSLIGGDPKWLMLGFMVPTWFLSMWISNTATTAMMLPIANAVVIQLEENANHQSAINIDTQKENITPGTDENGGHVNKALDMNNEAHVTVDEHKSTGVADAAYLPDETSHRKVQREILGRLSKGLTICVAYAANVGGTATLTGTVPNLVMKGFTDDIWKDHGLIPPISFATWMIYGLPGSFILLLVVWFWLQLLYLRSRAFCWKPPKADLDSTREVIKREYMKLGPISFAEGMSLAMFIILVLLWFFREPHFIPGWGDFFQSEYTDDSIPAIAIAIILFFIPQRPPACFRSKASPDAIKSQDMLLDWQWVKAKLPWGLAFLLGGGFALAKAATKSNLSLWIANRLKILEALPDWLMILVLCLMVALLTEFTSNTATCTLLMPIVSIMAENSGKNPLYLMFPVAISTSFAFMFPVATPPNAIAFATGRITVLDMVISGAILNVLCVLVVAMATHTWGMAYFNLDKIPWETNSTLAT